MIFFILAIISISKNNWIPYLKSFKDGDIISNYKLY